MYSPSISRGPIATMNVAMFMALAHKLIQRDPFLPGFGVFYGPSGFGKTFASIYAQNQTRAIRVEVGDYWTRKTLLQSILAEAGVKARGSISDMANATIHMLGDDPDRPLIIDEADRLISRGLVELVRDLQDKSTAPIILIGEEHLPAALQHNERMHNRVLDWVGAQPADLHDARALALGLCPTLDISDDLLAAIVERSGGRARRIVVNLTKVMDQARKAGAREMTLAAMGDTPLFEGRAPSARMFGRV